MRAADHLRTAQKLLSTRPGRPRQADLRRAQSAAYFAVLYAMCGNGADSFIGASAADRNGRAWRQVFRSVEHGFARSQCGNKEVMPRFPVEIQFFARSFIQLQELRHRADYAPDARFQLKEVQGWLDTAALAIAKLAAAPLKDRRAFAAWVLLRGRAGS